MTYRDGRNFFRTRLYVHQRVSRATLKPELTLLGRQRYSMAIDRIVSCLELAGIEAPTMKYIVWICPVTTTVVLPHEDSGAYQCNVVLVTRQMELRS